MCVLSIKVPIRKESANLLYALRTTELKYIKHKWFHPNLIQTYNLLIEQLILLLHCQCCFGGWESWNDIKFSKLTWVFEKIDILEIIIFTPTEHETIKMGCRIWSAFESSTLSLFNLVYIAYHICRYISQILPSIYVHKKWFTDFKNQASRTRCMFWTPRKVFETYGESTFEELKSLHHTLISQLVRIFC